MTARILEVDERSVAERAGVRPGDLLVQINGIRPRDILDYQILCDEANLDLILTRAGEELTFEISKSHGESLGLRFDASLFDGMMVCRNNCVFCFVDQLPPGVRKSLRVKDDDYRLSFIYGNFVTLTNLTDDDVSRIVRQRLSPLYVSLHTTDRNLHELMLRPACEDRAFERLKALLDGDVKIHIQIVLCPDYNDKAHLYRTLADLGQFKNVASVGIVPVGLSDHRSGLMDLTPVSSGDLPALLKTVQSVQDSSLIQRGVPWVYLADEFYAAFNLDLPSTEAYGDFPQLENGIGIARLFLEGIESALSVKPDLPAHRRFTTVTGKLSSGYLREAASMIFKASGLDISVIEAENHFLGRRITVAGLLAGRDVLKAIEGARNIEAIVIPDVMINEDKAFIDDMTIDAISEKAGVEVLVVPSDGEAFVEWLSGQGD